MVLTKPRCFKLMYPKAINTLYFECACNLRLSLLCCGTQFFVAKPLDVSASTLNRVIKGKSAISPEMALRLSKSLGRTPESWLTMQDNYDLWQAKQNENLTKVHTINFTMA